MKINRIKSKNEILITGCNKKLNFKQIDKVAKEEGLTDFAIEEEQVSGETGYSYKLKY